MKKIKIKFVFNLLPGMVLHTIVIHTKILFRAEIDSFRKKDDHNVIEGEAEFETSNSKFVFSFIGSGDVTTTNTEGSYNFSFKNKNIYNPDKTFIVNQDCNFGEVITDVELPK